VAKLNENEENAIKGWDDEIKLPWKNNRVTK
jgi:hypothetical protein